MILRVEDLSYSYGREDALAHISFQVAAGDYVGIIGSQRVRQKHAAQMPGRVVDRVLGTDTSSTGSLELDICRSKAPNTAPNSPYRSKR